MPPCDWGRCEAAAMPSANRSTMVSLAKPTVCRYWWKSGLADDQKTATPAARRNSVKPVKPTSRPRNTTNPTCAHRVRGAWASACVMRGLSRLLDVHLAHHQRVHQAGEL